MIALTRAVPPTINACELTHIARVPIDVDRARRQHAQYEEALARLGCEIVHVAEAPELPDSVFIEDAAVVTDEMAVITRPGAESRREETSAVADALGDCRSRVVQIVAPGTLDGGDVLVIGRDLFVGISSRTNLEGARQLVDHLADYDAQFVPVKGALHLKSAVTAIGARRLLLNPRWIDRGAFQRYDVIEVDPSEPYAANALLVTESVLYDAAFPKTRRRLTGIDVRTVDMSELAKAEGAVTCCCILVGP